MPSFEVLLPVGAIGFYLYDATTWLYGNEFVLERSRRGWGASLGSGLQLAGRRPHVPNPFAAGALQFRSRWDAGFDASARTALDVASLRANLRPLGVVVTLQAWLLLVVLPPVSIVLGAGWLLLAVFAAFYLLTVAALGLLVARRRALGIGTRQVAWLACEALLCAPFAVNLVRKVSLAQSHRLDWATLVETEGMPEERARLLAGVKGRIVELLAAEDPGTPASDRLEGVRARLEERLDVPVVE